ncbi:30S ribosomal protein S6 [candidate division TA06 bacterium]|uniref:Small ribosomal subunit protein bS6 n=1 Tax=candidate division TA06 bacterium TaxID=2250710 RepID=A0A933I9U4_UNCT6|nr:30S ribosomal protein S6 [candidate division TA06 bacterium]
MNAYETVLIIDPAVDEAGVDKQVEKYSALIKSHQGEIALVEKWGRRKMTYPINSRREGFYVCLQFTSPATLPAEINRNIRLDESIIRHLTIKGHASSVMTVAAPVEVPKPAKA